MKKIFTALLPFFLVLAAISLSFSQISLVKELTNLGADYGEAQTFIRLNNFLYFDREEGIYRTDGTAPGTTLVTSHRFLNNGINSQCVAGGNIYYANSSDLRRINGNTGADELIETFDQGGGAAFLVNVNGFLLYRKYYNNLWRSDGTTAGTHKVFDTQISDMVSNGSTAYFVSSDGGLWRTDGTTAATSSITLPPGFRIFSKLQIFKGELYWYCVDDKANYILTKIGSSQAVEVLFTSANRPYNLETPFGSDLQQTPPLFPAGDVAYFFGQTNQYNSSLGQAINSVDQIWRTDGTPSGTYKILTVGSNNVSVQGYYQAGVPPEGFNNVIFFAADDGIHGVELWRSDGTIDGTFLVRDIYPNAAGSYPRELSVIDGVCYFMANDGQTGYEVWKSDGTAAGTIRVMDLNPGNASAIKLQGVNQGLVNQNNYAMSLNGRYFFSGYTAGKGSQLYATGGFEPTKITSHYTDHLGWCSNCDIDLYRIADVNSKQQYLTYTFGDGATSSAGKFIISWDGDKWKNQYSEKSNFTSGIWIENPNYASNGLNTKPKPPCGGWSNGVSLTGDCVVASFSVIEPTGAPALNVSATITTGIINSKNAYEIPVSGASSGDKVTVQWNATLLRWEMVLVSPAGKISSSTVLASNSTDTGDNPPCSGWSGGYGLSGDICLVSTPLPVTLLAFTAKPTLQNAVQLNWQTTQETHSAYYQIERSKDMFVFEHVATLDAANNSDKTISYTHTDETPLKGRSYYRLRQVDTDGKENLYRSVTVRISGTDSPYPNPAKNGIVRIEATDTSPLRLTDISGRSISFNRKRIDEQIVEIIPKESLKPGIYVLSNGASSYQIVVE